MKDNKNKITSMSPINSRVECEHADDIDELRKFREKFQIPENSIYFMGNSLGVCSIDAVKAAMHVIHNEWAAHAIESYNLGWLTLPLKVGEKIGKLIGAETNETIVCDSTSVNIFKVVATSLAIQKLNNNDRRVIVLERANFPTDLYIVQGLVNYLSSVDGYEIRYFDAENPLESVLDENVAVVLLSLVNYRTSYLYDLNSITKTIHEVGAHVIWDLCHSVGSVLINLNEANADFAIGCTYKYLNCGPGGTSFLWAHKKHHNIVWQPLTGWHGHEAPFKMSTEYAPSKTISQFLVGAPPIIPIAMVDAGVQIFLDAGMGKLRKKSLQLSDLFIKLIDEKCPSLTLVTPRNHAERGGHLAYRHANGLAISKALRVRRVIGDFRYPDVLRFALAPLYLRFVDVWDAVDVICDVVNNSDLTEFEVPNCGDCAT